MSNLGLRLIDEAAIDRALPYPALIDRLAEKFRAEVTVPLRHHHPVEVPGAARGMLLLMPAWEAGKALGIKIVSVYPDNGKRGLPSIVGLYLLADAATGVPTAILDGRRLTLRRTAAASALAARHLARADARHLVMIGAGALAPYLVEAHAAVRPIRQVTVWNRTAANAAALADALTAKGFAASATVDAAAAVASADIVSCATLSATPVLRGAWLKPGCHVDLVGGFTPGMREADDEAVRRAELFVDTRTGGLTEAGDIVDPLKRGVIKETDIRADLFELARGQHPGRGSPTAITLFKSVGTAIEDLAAAELCLERL
ncbi:MAG: ornithine cyclodeaminase family protein [Alphaproteobacteria bacterium]|nr:ornithine cyclodeaminase family protein [Alphaproteobacteria bacterium]